MRDPHNKILTLAQAVAWHRRLRDIGATLVVTNGCFDLLHRGHAELLYRARKEGDALLVLLNSDASVRALKGPTRPVVPELDRAFMLASLSAVSVVVLFKATDCAAELAALQPEVYAKGEEYRHRQHPAEAAALANAQTRFVWQPRLLGLSTTGLLQKIEDASGGREGSDDPSRTYPLTGCGSRTAGGRAESATGQGEVRRASGPPGRASGRQPRSASSFVTQPREVNA